MRATTAVDLLQEGLELHRRGAADEAAARYDEVLRVDPGNAHAHYYLGMMSCQHGRFADGVRHARESLAGNPRNAPALILLGRALCALGHFEEALPSFAQAIELAPDLALAHCFRADVLNQLGRATEAIDGYDRALALAPDLTDAWFNRGLALIGLSRLSDAVSSFDRAIAVRPDFVEASLLRAKALLELKRYTDALDGVGKVIALQPEMPEAWLGRANVLSELRRYDEALAACDQALALKADFAEAWLGRGNVLRDLKRYKEALAACDRSVALLPGLAEAWLGRGNILADLKRYDEASAAYDHALALKPGLADAWLGRGNILAELKHYDEALAAYYDALALNPDLANAWLGRGEVYVALRRHREALECFAKCQHFAPASGDGHFSEACCRLLLGDTERGWEKYESRWETRGRWGSKRNFPQPLWLGDAPLSGKTIFLHAEQGFGDTILACRYVRMVAALGARVILEVQPSLTSLLQGLEGVSKLIAKAEPIPDFDFHCPLMSLPLAFKTRLDSIPGTTPYLNVPKAAVEKWRMDGSGFKIGVAWAGNIHFAKDHGRSVLLPNMLPIFAKSGAKYFSIQKDLRPGDEEILRAHPQIVNLGSLTKDFQDTAAIITSLDLIISSDTSIVNLAGALGRPVWVLLSFNPDWRWLLDRSDSLWYPSARLFRQTRDGDWASVVANVCTQLDLLLSDRGQAVGAADPLRSDRP